MQFKIPRPKTLIVLILGAAALYGFFLIFPYLQIGMDWEQTYRPAAVLAGFIGSLLELLLVSLGL